MCQNWKYVANYTRHFQVPLKESSNKAPGRCIDLNGIHEPKKRGGKKKKKPKESHFHFHCKQTVTAVKKGVSQIQSLSDDWHAHQTRGPPPTPEKLSCFWKRHYCWQRRKPVLVLHSPSTGRIPQHSKLKLIHLQPRTWTVPWPLPLMLFLCQRKPVFVPGCC